MGGEGVPVVTDGPFPEAKELLAGYRIVDVETPERALEIAAQLNRAIALAMVDGPAAGLGELEQLEDRLPDHQRLHAARAHLHELAGDFDTAIAEYRAAAARIKSLPEQHYLIKRAAQLDTRQREGSGRHGERSQGVAPSSPGSEPADQRMTSRKSGPT